MKLLKSGLLAVSAALALSASVTAVAGGDVEAGKAKAMVCAGCHGANGKAIAPMYPNLNGQNEMYLVGALKAYKAKQRTGGMAGIMQGQASTLSDADIANLAAYYASLK